MAFLSSAPISRVGVAILRDNLVLTQTGTVVPAGEFGGPSGGTVTLRVRIPRTASEQTTPGAAQTPTVMVEVPVDVSLRHFFDLGLVTSEDLTLSIEEYARQVLEPQVIGVATAAEQTVADELNDLDAAFSFGATPDGDEDRLTFLQARAQLTKNGAPAGGRWLAASPDVMTRLFNVRDFVRVDASGSDSALRRAVMGTIFGVNVIESGLLDEGTAAMYHSSGIAIGSAVPVAPQSVDSSVATDGGWSLRTTRVYSAERLSEISSVSIFAGAAVVSSTPDSPDVHPRIVKLAIGT